MSAGGTVASSRGGGYRRLLLVAMVGIGGLFLLHRQEIASGFEVAIGEPGDDRLNNWVLEHGYRWLRGDRAHADYWSPPFFHPEPNVAAYTEVLLGLQPIYAAARLAGLDPERALAVLALTLSTLNFAAFYLLAKRFLGFGTGAATAGAFLFAFSSPRAVGLNHLQMTAGFFGVAAFAALVAIFAERRSGRGWIALFWLSCLLQLYSGVYHAWFLGFLVALAVGIALAQEHGRRRLLGELRRAPLAWAGGALVVAVASWPLAAHYLAAAGVVGARPLAVVLQLLPRPESWLNLGPGSLLYGSLTHRFWGPTLPFEWTHRLGLGFLTWALVLWGAALALRRQEGPLRLLVLAFGLAVLLATRWPGDWSLWRGVYELVPGATAIRAVGRLAVVGLLPVALCLALAWRHLEATRRFRAWLVPLAVLVVLEQVQTPETYPRQPVRETTIGLAQRIPADCSVFFYSSRNPGELPHHVHLDAMWAAMETGIPTINGYSGGVPPEWRLREAVEQVSNGEADLREGLRGWITTRRIPEAVCWIRWDGARDRPATVERLPAAAVLPRSRHGAVAGQNAASRTRSRATGRRRFGHRGPRSRTARVDWFTVFGAGLR